MDRTISEWGAIAGWAVPFTNLHNILVLLLHAKLIKADIAKQVEV